MGSFNPKEGLMGPPYSNSQLSYAQVYLWDTYVLLLSTRGVDDWVILSKNGLISYQDLINIQA